MGGVAAIGKCSKDICCPQDFKILDNNQRENSVINKSHENLINSINQDDNYNHKNNILDFEHDDYNIYDNDAKIEAHEYENNLENIQFFEHNFKNEIESINDENNNIFESSQKSGINSSNFSFKCFVKNSKKNFPNSKKNNDKKSNGNKESNIHKESKIHKENKYNKENNVHKENNFEDSESKENSENEEMNDIVDSISDNNSINIKEDNSKISKQYISNIKKIQRIYRKYINKKRISEKKTNYEEDEKENGNIRDKIHKINADLCLTKIKSSKNYTSLLLNRYLIDIDFVDVSEESFRSVTMKSHRLQEFEPPQYNTLRDLDNDQIKGYFLLKKKMFTYQGQKDKQGKKIGFGRVFWEDSSKLKGYFTDSKLNGIVYFYNCGNEKSTYYGEYKDNVPDGYGIYSRKGYILEGKNWNKNNLNDIGVAIWEEGELYEGEFKNSVKEGIGLYRWADGTSYLGQFKKNKISGMGRMSFANGNTYEGEFDEGFLSGWGKFIWDDGKYYIGNYLKDKKHGFGIFVWSLDPLIALIGFWNQGKQSGISVKLFKGHCKIVFANESKNLIEIHSRYEISKYLLPSQVKYKNFFKKKYNEFAKFINFASK